MQEQDRGLSVRTLAIASIASAAAAVITSQFWIRGTPIAAALTPIIVALVSELLHRPTDKLAERLTAETDALPEAAGAQPPPARQASDPQPAPTAPADGPPEFTLYRSAGRRRRRRIAWLTVLGTGLLGFLIAAAALTIPEALSGKSLFNDRKTTLGGAKRHDTPSPDRSQTETAPAQTQTETVTETTTVPAPPAQRRRADPDRTTEQDSAPAPQTTAPERAPPATAPESTAPAE